MDHSYPWAAAAAALGFVIGMSLPMVLGEQSGGDCAPGQYIKGSHALVGSSLAVGSVETFGFLDDDGDGVYDADERAYATTYANGTGSVGSADVRVSNTLSFARGSQVRTSDPDFGDPLNFGTLWVGYFDDDGDNSRDSDEIVYLQLNSPTGTVSVRNIRLTTESNYGDVVGAGDFDLNRPLVSVNADVLYLDRQGSSSYGIGDLVVADADRNGVVSVGDFCLSGNQPSATSSATTTTTTSTTPTTTTTSTTPTTTNPPPTTSSSASPTTSTSAPAPTGGGGGGGSTSQPQLGPEEQERLRRLREDSSDVPVPGGGTLAVLAGLALAAQAIRRRF